MSNLIELSHPGEILLEEFLEPLEISQYRLAKEIHVPARRINEIVHGKRSVTPDTALRLAKFFGMSDSFWVNLQTDYDMRIARRELRKEIAETIVPFPRPDLSTPQHHSYNTNSE